MYLTTSNQSHCSLPRQVGRSPRRSIKFPQIFNFFNQIGHKVRSVRPRASIQRGDCSSAADAHPTQLWKGKSKRSSRQSRGTTILGKRRRSEEERTEGMLDRGQGSREIGESPRG